MSSNFKIILKTIQLCLLFNSFVCLSQLINPSITNIPMSPNVSSLFNFAGTQINESRGTSDVNFPIYTGLIDDVKLNINMSYDSNGIDVGYESSSIGTSWNIHNTGVINRIQNGLPDEETKLLSFGRSASNCTTIDVVSDAGWFQNEDLSYNLANQLEQNGNLIGYNSAPYASYDVNDKNFNYDIIQPDIFKYVLPNGKNGSFIITKGNMILNSSNDKITVTYDSANNISSFTIVDDLGNSYYFTVIEYLKGAKYFQGKNNTTQVSILPAPAPTSIVQTFSDFPFPCPGYTDYMDLYNKEVSTSWFLSKIITNKNKEIDFTYEDENYVRLTPLTTTATYNLSPLKWQKVISNNVLTYKTKRLNKINWAEGKIEFNYRSDLREDMDSAPGYNNGIGTLNSKALDNVKVYDSNNQERIKVVFNTSYKLSNGINLVADNIKYLYKRLWLDGIVINNNQSYQFIYNSNNLPNKLSYEIDFWGKYNGNNADTNGKSNLPDLWYYPNDNRSYTRPTNLSIFRRSNFTGLEYKVSAMTIQSNVTTTFGSYVSNRDTDEDKSKYGILERIIYPTKGYENFEYESNDFIYDGETRKGFGLRIKKINVFDNNDILLSSTSYDYKKSDGTSSGMITNLPIFGNVVRFYYRNVYNVDELRAGFTFSSSSISDENNLYYSRVEKKILDNGKIISEYNIPYSMETENALPFNGSYLYKKNYNKTSINIYHLSDRGPLLDIQNDYEYYPLSNNINLQNMFGNKSKEYIYDKNGSLKKLLEFKYILREDSKRISYFLGQTPNKIPNTLLYLPNNAHIDYFPNNSVKRHRVKAIIFSDFLLSETKQTDYFSTGNIVQEKSYLYSPQSLIAEVKKTDSKGKDVRTMYKYPNNFTYRSSIFGPVNGQWTEIPVTNIYAKMVDKNMINYPVETVVSIDNKVISSDVVDFQEKSAGYKSVIVPAILKKLESISPLSDYVFGKIDWQGSFVLDSRIKSKIIYDSYDSAGNLTMYHKTNGIYITTLWGYNKTYLIAQIENATNLQIASALGVSNLDSINESNLASVNALRTSQPNTMIKTYTYLPLIGVSTITDPRGNTTTYTYDAFGRLEFVKDAQGNLLSENQYKYKNQ